MSRVALGGSYRLSTAFALGWSFRSAIGFELEVPTREGFWQTDDRPQAGEPDPSWRFNEPSSLDSDHLVVSIGVLHDPSEELLTPAGVSSDAVIGVNSEPLTSARAAQASAGLVERSVDMAARRLKPSGIKLFIAGPAAFAVALGHR